MNQRSRFALVKKLFKALVEFQWGLYLAAAVMGWHISFMVVIAFLIQVVFVFLLQTYELFTQTTEVH